MFIKLFNKNETQRYHKPQIKEDIEIAGGLLLIFERSNPVEILLS